jgi:hypothetical protein
MTSANPHQVIADSCAAANSVAIRNMFWRRLPDGSGKIEAAGARALCVGDAEPLGHNIIHSVTNPIPRLTGAIHVYGGDFFAAERSEWDPESLQEGRYDLAKNMKLFEEANALLRRGEAKTFRIIGTRVSAFGQKLTSRSLGEMSAFGGKADIAIEKRHFRF